MNLDLSPQEPARVVLDTNVVLDWLLFRDADIQHLASAVETRAVSWVACTRMRSELARTLSYPNLAKWLPDSERMLARFDQWAIGVPDPASSLPLLRCSDPDDQVFLDLAIDTGARWLVTHDRALLRLSRRAAAQGLAIVRPASWRPAQ